MEYIGAKEIIKNVSEFLKLPIIPIATYEYKKSLQALLSGYNYEAVIKWYEEQPNVESGTQQLDKIFRQAFNGEMGDIDVKDKR